jgi:hypothetical protein
MPRSRSSSWPRPRSPSASSDATRQHREGGRPATGRPPFALVAAARSAPSRPAALRLPRARGSRGRHSAPAATWPAGGPWPSAGGPAGRSIRAGDRAPGCAEPRLQRGPHGIGRRPTGRRSPGWPIAPGAWRGSAAFSRRSAVGSAISRASIPGAGKRSGGPVRNASAPRLLIRVEGACAAGRRAAIRPPFVLDDRARRGPSPSTLVQSPHTSTCTHGVNSHPALPTPGTPSPRDGLRHPTLVLFEAMSRRAAP